MSGKGVVIATFKGVPQVVTTPTIPTEYFLRWSSGHFHPIYIPLQYW